MNMIRYTFGTLLILSLLSCGGSSDSVESPPLLRPVKYAIISDAASQEIHTFSGVAQAEKESKLSFRVSGTVRNLNIKLGDRVRKGQLIATLDPVDYTIQAEQASASTKGAEANLKSAENQMLIAKSNYNRIERLYENNSIPLSEFEQAKSNLETAQSQYEASLTQVTSSQKQYEVAANQVQYTRLVAPFSGVITAVNIEANELIASGNPIAVLSATNNPEVNVGIPENLIAQIKKKQQVKVAFSVLPNQPFNGIVEEVSFAAGNTPTYPAIIRIENPSPTIRPGMAANVTFNLSAPDAQGFILCPVKAIGSGPDGAFAFVLTDTDDGAYLVKKRQVDIGKLQPGGFEVKAGLEKGERVAVAGLKALLDGMKVTLLEE